MTDVESLEAKVAEMFAEAERLRREADDIDEEADELAEAIRVIRRHAKRREESAMLVDVPAEPAPRRTLARKLTRKEMVRRAAPKTPLEAVGPRELTDLVNAMFNTKYKPDHIRPIIWTMATKTEEAESYDGRYWIPEKKQNENYDL